MTDDPEPVQGQAGAWAPVIYFRTHRVDAWWRALPAGVDPGGPIAGVITAALGGGWFPAPRFVLARLDAGTLAGVACAASQFGTEMAADADRRPLYGFVGWYCADPRVIVPTLAELADDWKRLVRAEYDPVMGPAWLASAAEAQVPVVWEPSQPPWAPPGGRRLATLPPGLSDVAAPDAGVLRVFPSVSAALVWQAVADYGVRAAVATGWKTYKSAIQPFLTHVCADDATGSFPMPAPPPTAEERGAAASGRRDQAGSVGQNAPSQSASAVGPSAWRNERDADQDALGTGGRLLGRLRDLGDGVKNVKNVKKVFPDARSGGDDGLPRPPEWAGGWTFRPPATFLSEERHYVYWYVIGEPAVHCMDQRLGKQFDWTASGWVPAEPGPAAPGPDPGGPGVGPEAGPGINADLRIAMPQPLTEEKRRKLASTFGGFSGLRREREAEPGTDEAPGPDQERG
ncbi:MAG TPA: hypothetical protein VHZ33_37465 [Trebonia sp.]|jgi:hypothetical protein|nr:hypothetical protein [Trebonia sp.]